MAILAGDMSNVSIIDKGLYVLSSARGDIDNRADAFELRVRSKIDSE